MNLPSDIQRLLPYIAVAVLAVVGLLLVVRGVGPGDGGTTNPSGIEMRTDSNPETGPGGDGGSRRGGDRAPAKRSPEAYVNCVQQAVDTVALEKCQRLLP
jgi:hypothetical protein